VRVVLKNLTLPPYKAHEDGREGTLIKCVSRWSLAPEPDPLPQGITVERGVFSFWCVLLEFVWFSWRSEKLLAKYNYLLQEPLQG